MKLLDLLLYQLRQFELSTKDLKEAANVREKAALMAEMRSHHRLLDSTLERLENEHFRKDPNTLLQRSLLCYNPDKILNKDIA